MTETTPRTCSWCGRENVTEACPTCQEDLPKRRKHDEMTGAERRAELESFDPILEVDFSTMHARIEELVGRPVWKHEMGTSGWEGLLREAESGVVNEDAPFDSLPTGVPTIVAVGGA